MKLQSDGTDAFLSVGTIAFGSETNAGILIGNDGGNAELRLYKDADEFFTYDATAGFDLRTTSFRVNTTGLDISGTSGTGTSNFLKLGSATTVDAGEGFYIDGGGNFRVGTATSGTDFMKFTPSGDLVIKSTDIDITSTTFNLDATTLTIDSSGDGGAGSITVGSNITLNGSSTSTIAGWSIDSDSIFTGTKDSSGFATSNADITINSTSGIHTKNFYVDTSGNAEFRGTVTIGSTDLTESNTLNTEDPLGAGVLNFNPDFTQVAADGRPAGVKAVYGNATAANISYQDASQTILKLHHASDVSIGAGLPAIKINKDAQYRISFRVKSNAATLNGFYFRVQELDDELEGDETHISNNAGGSESGVEEDTRQILFNGSDPNEILVGTATENGPITTSFVQYEVLYTPTSTAKYFSPIFLNWTDMSTNELHIEKVLVQIDTSTKQQGTVGGWTIDSNAIYRGTELADDTFASSTGQITLGAGFIGAKEFKIASSGAATFKGTLSAPSGEIGGWIIGATTLQSATSNPDIVLDKGNEKIQIVGTTNAGGNKDTTAELFNDSTDGSSIRLQRDGFDSSTPVDIVKVSSTQEFEDDLAGSYTNGIDTQAVSGFSGTSATLTTSMTSNTAWPAGNNNPFGYFCGTSNDTTFGFSTSVPNGTSGRYLLDTGLDYNTVQVQLQNFTNEIDSLQTAQVLFRWKAEVYQTNNSNGNSAELVHSFSITSKQGNSDGADPITGLSEFLINKRYWYIKFIGTRFDNLTNTDTSGRDHKLAFTNTPAVMTQYLAKTRITAMGIQTFSGPNQNATFGSRNEVLGDFSVKKTSTSTRGNLTIEGSAAIGASDTDDTYTLYTDGDIGASGNIVAYSTSDKRLKENIIEIEDGLSLVNQLRPVQFDWKKKNPFGYLNPTEYGLLAQDVEKVLPLVVGTMKGDYKGIDYEKLIPILISSIQELSTKVKELERKVNDTRG